MCWENFGKSVVDCQGVRTVCGNFVGKSPEITKNRPKQQKTRGKTILDNQGVTTVCGKTKKSVGKLWENYN